MPQELADPEGPCYRMGGKELARVTSSGAVLLGILGRGKGRDPEGLESVEKENVCTMEIHSQA